MMRSNSVAPSRMTVAGLCRSDTVCRRMFRCGARTDPLLHTLRSRTRRPAWYIDTDGTDARRARRGRGLSGPLSLRRASRRADCGIGSDRHSLRNAAGRWTSHRRVGASDYWCGTALRSVPRGGCLPADAGAARDGGKGLRRRGDRLSRTRYGGPHPYLVGVSEARAVLDSVRAAREMPGAGGGNRFAVWGHSQGGQASLYTGILAKSYAPDLELVGVAAAAPATELAKLMTDDLDSNGGRNLTAMTLWSWTRVFGAPMERVLEAAAIPVVNLLAEECIESIFDIALRQLTARSLVKTFLSVPNPVDLEPWRSLAADNTPGVLPAVFRSFSRRAPTTSSSGSM